MTFDAARLHYAELSLIGSFHYTPDEAKRRDGGSRRTGRWSREPLVSDAGALSDLPRFLEAQARGEGIRYAIRP